MLCSDAPITKLLERFGEGDSEAADELARAVYSRLHSQASALLRNERPGHIQQPTSLINELFARPGWKKSTWQNREDFYAFAFRAMRRILIDEARRLGRAKRGKRAEHVTFDDADFAVSSPQEDHLAMRAAFGKLEEKHPQQAQIYWMSVIEGVTEVDISKALSMSRATVQRQKRRAAQWLLEELSRPVL